MEEEDRIKNEIDSLESEIRKKLHMKPTGGSGGESEVASDKKQKSGSSSSESDEDVDMVAAVLTLEFGSTFRCSAEEHCQYEDPLCHPKGNQKQN